MSNEPQKKCIWTIGHSTRSIEDFIKILQASDISLLADVRSFPGSKRYPHFNKSSLKLSLKEENINYLHFPGLGGRRQPNPDSVNTAWRHSAFRGYADYMDTDEFKEAIEKLEEASLSGRTAYMCAEALWWKCHRSLVSDYLKTRDWTVIHIMELNKFQEHPYTLPANIKQGMLFYSEK